MNDSVTLAKNNGLWKSILALSNYVLVDAPILGNSQLKDVEELLFTTGIKQHYLYNNNHNGCRYADKVHTCTD